MRQFVIAAASIPLAGLLSAGSCEPPPRGDGPDGPAPVAPATCAVDDISIAKPDALAVRADGGALELACMGEPEVLGQSTSVRLQGCIDVFGLGGRAEPGIRVEIFSADKDPKSDAPDIGSTTIGVTTMAPGLDCAGADAGSAPCLALECTKEGAYVMENVPVHVPLIMKAYLPGDNSVIETYTFGVVFGAGDARVVDVAGVPTVKYSANVIYRSTYDTIPTLAGRQVEGQQFIGDGLGRGVIAGEIHDCADKVVQGATVTTSQADASTKITYFNGNVDDPKPDLRRSSTGADGLYVVLNASTDAGTNAHVVSAAILDPSCTDASDETCQCVSMSSRAVKVYPDSVSIVTLRGDLPVIR